MSLHISSQIRIAGLSVNASFATELLNGILQNWCNYFFDYDSIRLIYNVQIRFPEIRELVDATVLHLGLQGVRISTYDRWEIITDVLKTRNADTIVAYLDQFHNSYNQAVTCLYSIVCERDDLPQIGSAGSVISKLWSTGYIPWMGWRIQPTFSLVFSYPNKLDYILQQLYQLDGFVAKMGEFIDEMFVYANRKAKHLHALCKAGFAPSTECMIRMLMKMTKGSNSLYVILIYHLDLIQMLLQIEYMLNRLLCFYQSADLAEMMMIQVLKQSCFDYLFEALPDVFPIASTTVKLYGLQYSEVIRCFFQYHLPEYCLGYLFDSPMVRRTPYNTMHHIAGIREKSRVSIIGRLKCHIKNYQRMRHLSEINRRKIEIQFTSSAHDVT